MKYDNVRVGLNSRLDSIQAAILQVKLKAFKDYELDDVNKVADKYTEMLREALGDKVAIWFMHRHPQCMVVIRRCHSALMTR